LEFSKLFENPVIFSPFWCIVTPGGYQHMPSRTKLVRPETLTEQLKTWVRNELLRNPGEGGRAILSERKLAEVYGVSRTTARRALRQLLADGYLVSVPRQGYRLSDGPSPTSESVVALVRRRSERFMERDFFPANLLRAMQWSAANSDKDLLIMGREGRSAAEIAEVLRERGVVGVIADCDDMEFARELGGSGLPVVAIDGADPEVESVVQDNFGGALLATQMLIEAGHQRIACLLYDSSPGLNLVHYRERRAGYLAAMSEAGLKVDDNWMITASGSPVGGKALAEVIAATDGPTAAVVLWSELLPDVGRELRTAGLNIDLSVWWGGVPEGVESWKADFPEMEVPLGVSWDPGQLTQRALEQLEALRLNPTRSPARTLISLRKLDRQSGSDLKASDRSND
jgi:DNA-binding LacI/PurR family transcriptional regulator